MIVGAQHVLAAVLIYFTAHSIGEDVHGCYKKQHEAVLRYGKSAPLFYWYPRCLPGGYFQNVQCNAFVGCHCSYIDTGRQIPGTFENNFIRFMMYNCPLVSEVAPDPCSMPPPNYPCKSTSRKFNYNPSSGECEESQNSCLGFETKDACSTSCVVTKRDKCSFRMAKGQHCLQRTSSIRWYHDEETGSCDSFLFKGCGGNSNNYPSKWMCLKTCEYGNNTELIIKVGNFKYYISIPTWLVEKKGYHTDQVEELSVEQFKDIEEHLIKISKFDSDEEGTTDSKEEEYEQFRPEHADKKMSRKELCSMKKAPGPCRGFFGRWYFDEEQSKCVKFIFGGCYGNANRHMSATGCATFCDAKVKPSEAELFEDLITGAGGLSLGGLLPEYPKVKEQNGGARSLELKPPSPQKKEVVGDSTEIEFTVEDDVEETTAEQTTTVQEATTVQTDNSSTAS